MTPAADAMPGPSPGRRLRRWGAALIVLALLGGGGSIAAIAGTAGRSVYDSLTSPVYRAPMDEQLPLQRGRYVILEQVDTGVAGQLRPAVGLINLLPGDVSVTAPDGSAVAVGYPSSQLTVARGQSRFIGAVAFDTDVAGRYRVRAGGAVAAHYIIARDLGSALRASLRWIGTLGLSVLALLTGLGLLIGGFAAAGRHRRLQSPWPAPTWPAAPVAPAAPAGWYPDPQSPGRSRYFDGYRWLP